MSVGNISLHFQTFILPFILVIQWEFCLHTESGNSQCCRDLISSSSSLSGMTWRNRTNWDRINPEELWQRLQDTSRNLFAHSSCTSLFILIFIKSTVDCIAHFSSLHILLLILFYFILFLLIFYLIPTYIYIYSPVLCFIFYFIFLHCPLSGPVLTYISLLIIPCMIVYVTNKQEPWTLEPYFHFEVNAPIPNLPKFIYVRANHSSSSFIYRRSEYNVFLWIFANHLS